MVNFSLLRGFHLRFNEELLNWNDFLIEESKVRIFLVKQLVHYLHVIMGRHPL